MRNIILAGAAVLAMTTCAYAQSAPGTTSSTHSVTETSPSGEQTVRREKSETTVDADGIQSQKNSTYQAKTGSRDDSLSIEHKNKVTDAAGNQIEASRSYSRDENGKTVKSKTRSVTPEGTEETTHETRTAAPK